MICENCNRNDNLPFKCYTCEKQLCRSCISSKKHNCVKANLTQNKFDIFCDNKDCIEIHYLNTCKKCNKKFCKKHMNHQCKKKKWLCFF